MSYESENVNYLDFIRKGLLTPTPFMSRRGHHQAMEVWHDKLDTRQRTRRRFRRK